MNFNEESLFELNIDFNAQGNYGVYGMHPTPPIMGLIVESLGTGNDGTEGASNPLGYGNEVIHDQNVLRLDIRWEDMIL